MNGGLELGIESGLGDLVIYLLEFGERLDLVLWETCHIYATCQAYRAEAEFQHYPVNLLLQKGVDYESLEEYKAVVHGMALFLMEDGTFSSSLE